MMTDKSWFDSRISKRLHSKSSSEVYSIYSFGTGGCLCGERRPESEADHLSPSSPRLGMRGSTLSTPPPAPHSLHAIMACCIIKYRGHTFLLGKFPSLPSLPTPCFVHLYKTGQNQRRNKQEQWTVQTMTTHRSTSTCSMEQHKVRISALGPFC